MQPTPTTSPDIVFHIPADLIEHVSFSGVVVQRMIQAGSAAALTEANATIERQKAAMAAMEQVNGQQAVKLREALDVIAEQSRRIALLEKPVVTLPKPFEPVPPSPPVVPVTPLKPIITKTELNYVAGACVTLGFKPPSATVDATARELMKLISSMGFNTVRFFRNKDEVRDDLKRNPEDPRNLYAAAKKLGLTVVADTINRAALDLSDTELSQYLAGLKSLGAALLVFDDANQYVEPKKDGTRYPPNTLKDMVARVRQYSDLPIIASVRANARVEDYKPLFEWVEFQTFGRLTELDDFLRLPADCFVLDGQATVGNDYLRGAHDVIMKYPPNAFFYYSSLDEDTDWRTMPDKVALIEKTVKAWNAARLVKAQPA